MARLADTIAAGEVRPPRWLTIEAKDLPGWHEGLAKAIEGSRVLVADDVVDLYFSADGAEWEIGTDFPDVSPPKTLFWIEGRRPSGAAGSALPTTWGWLFEAHFIGHLAGQPRQVTPEEVSDVRRSLEAYWPMYGAEIDAAIAAHGEDVREHLPFHLRHLYDMRRELAQVDAGQPVYYPADQQWEVRALLFQEEGRAAVGPICRLDIQISATGKVLNYFCGPIFSEGVPEKPPQDLATTVLALAKPMLLALSLLHCEGAEAKTQEPAPKLSRAYKRRHGRSLLSYEELDAHPIRQNLGEEVDAQALRQALAACQQD
ncbi:MAG: hypothetical protein ACYC1C_10210 [Chloroflexota bacterium]